MQPTATQIRLPRAYGSPSRLLAWDAVERKLEQAMQYWLATTRPDGRPHVVPVDGVWLDGAWYFGGHPNTVHQRNLRDNPEVVVHLDGAVAAVIAEGRAGWATPSLAQAKRLSAASKQKYGYSQPASAYREGVWRLRPRHVLAWENLPEDATRFTFDEGM